MFSEIQKRLIEVQQSRSNFQINSFVIGQHGTAEMQYVQLLVEIAELETSLKKAKLSLREMQIKLKATRNRDKELEQIEKSRIQIDICNLEIVIISTQREFDYFQTLFDSVEHHFTRAEIEDGQKEYWKEKLGSNARAMIHGNNPVPFAYIESMQQAGVFDDFVSELSFEFQKDKELSE